MRLDLFEPVILTNKATDAVEADIDFHLRRGWQEG
jgi:hypothetical protein